MTNGNGRRYLKPGTTLKLKGEFVVHFEPREDKEGNKWSELHILPTAGGDFLSFGPSRKIPGFVYGEVKDGGKKMETPKTYTLG